ncbi:MAG: hypothetical protein ACKO2V_06660 [Snowella sp.]
MTDSENQRLDRMETTLDTQGNRLDRIEQDLTGIKEALTSLVTEIKIYDSKLDAYQKASQQVVNIAFGLLATSALAIIIPAVLNR